MLAIALCDDEETELNRLETVISKYCTNKRLNYALDKYLTGTGLLESHKEYSIIFLDIKMRELSGIELAIKIRERDKRTKIIYVTNFPNYQTDAFTVRAFGYVVKPYNEQMIFKQLEDAIEYTNQENVNYTFTFNTDQGIRTVSISDIYYFESISHKVKIQCSQNTYIIKDSIANVLNNFKAYGFSMPHKSYIINLNYVSFIKGYDIILTNGVRIPISQKRAVQFKSELHLFLKNNFNLLMR